MKYNIDIFKTPSYQKIFKEVLKLRHPNLSEEEALKEEVKTIDCLLLVDYRKEQDAIARIHCFEKRYSLLHFYHFAEGGLLYAKGDLNLHRFEEVKHRILGRPITISELVDVLNRKEKFKDDFETIVEYGYYYQDNAICEMRYFKGSKMFKLNIVIEFNKSINFLHELKEYTLNEIVDELD